MQVDLDAKQHFENYDAQQQNAAQLKHNMPADDLIKAGYLKSASGQKIFAPINLNNHWENVQLFYELTPYFYDKTGCFWVWDDTNCFWQMIDDVDLIVKIENQLSIRGYLSAPSFKSLYLESMKKFGRQKQPKPAPSKWLQFKNKAFSLESGNIYNITKDYFFTNPIPYKIGDSTETPIFDKLFTEWVGAENKQQLYEILAYCTYTEYPIQVLFCFNGSGRNGKSTFLKLLSRFIGSDNICNSDLDLIAGQNFNRFETMKLYKKLVCLMGETNFGVLRSSAILKKLTGGDLIGFEMKGKQPFDAYNYAKIIIATNSLPTSEDTSEGWYRRWIIMDFNNQFPEGKDILLNIPETEFENLAKKVCITLQVLLERGSFTHQGTIEDRRNKYIMTSNPLPAFIEQQCILDPNKYVRFSEFFTVYTNYLNINKRRNINKKELSKLLSIEGLEIRKTSKDGNIDYFIEGLEFKYKFPQFPRFPNNYYSSPYMETKIENKEIGEIRENFNSHIKSAFNVPTETQVNNLKMTIEKCPIDNIDLCISLFGQEFIDFLRNKGEIYESPKGTLKWLN